MAIHQWSEKTKSIGGRVSSVTKDSNLQREVVLVYFPFESTAQMAGSYSSPPLVFVQVNWLFPCKVNYSSIHNGIRLGLMEYVMYVRII